MNLIFTTLLQILYYRFAPVSILQSNITRKVTASFFMMLFIMVLAVKAFHKHDGAFAAYTSFNKQTTVAAKFACCICEFQLAKDCDTEISLIQIQSPVKFVFSHYHFSTDKIIFADKKFSVRGPPVLL